MQNNKVKSAVVLVALVAVFAGLLSGANLLLGPIIEKNNAAQSLGAMAAVLPGAAAFDTLYDVNDIAVVTTLTDLPATVVAVYAENSGLGHVVKLSTTEGYTGAAIEMLLGVDAEGKIAGLEITAYPETKGQDGTVNVEYPLTFVGQDSALADVGLVAGVTYSSSAIRNAVADGMNALVANGLMSAGVKSDAQLLTEQLGVLFSGAVNASGVAQIEETEVSGTYLQTAMKALNGSGYAFIAADGDATVLAVANLTGCTVYDVNGADVTEQYTAVAEEAAAYAASNLQSFTDADIARFEKIEGVSSVSEVAVNGVYNSVTSAFTVKYNGKNAYAFAARPYAYANETIVVYFIVGENGAIEYMTASALILHGEYFNSYTLDETSYKAGFVGLTAETWTGEQAFISGATMTADAITVATNDMFAAFQTLTGGAN